jgi:hypothetical protein
VFRLRMLPVKNSRKRSAARSPALRRVIREELRKVS